jgi:hypothetical protein
MKPIEKLKTQRTIDRIQRGDFNDEDVEVVILRLREYSRSFQVFREVANFVAHNDVRDQGITNKSLDAFYLAFKYGMDYIGSEKKLDITKRFPSYVMYLLVHQLRSCSNASLREHLNMSRKQVGDILKSVFIEDECSKTCVLANDKITRSEFLVLQHLLGFIKVRPVFTPHEFMLEFFKVLKSVGIVFCQSSLELQRPKIILSIGLLLHMTKFKLGDGTYVTCLFNSDFQWVADGISPSDDGFGMLSVYGEVEYVTGGQPFKMIYSLFDTELKASNSCHERMFKAENHPEDHNVTGRRLEFERPLQMIDGKLAPI